MADLMGAQRRRAGMPEGARRARSTTPLLYTTFGEPHRIVGFMHDMVLACIRIWSMVMDHTENNDATKLTPSPSSRSFFVFVALIVALQILIAVISYPFLPDQVPSHWNAAGQVNG